MVRLRSLKAELANQPKDMRSILYMADSYLQLNNYAEAEPLLLQVMRQLPEKVLAHIDLGILYTETDRKQEAVKQLLEAERLEPKNVNVHWRLGRLYRSMGKAAEAKAELELATEINKQQDATLLNVLSSPKENAMPAKQPNQ